MVANLHELPYKHNIKLQIKISMRKIDVVCLF